MAIQNFLSGGYYGKLGATVGQRWKNKRTIRTYVVPRNPRTTRQQANRGQFANAVGFAQMGMQMNYYATCFEDENFTRWNYRMKIARALRDSGMALLDLIPLYPIAFIPPTLITSIIIDSISGTNHITFAAGNLNEDTDRTLSMMFALYDTSNRFLGYKLYIGYYYASNPGYIECDVDNITEINTYCKVRIVSNDDENSVEDMIASPTLTVQTSGIDIRAFNTEIREVQKTASGLKIIFNELWKNGATTNSGNVEVHCIIGGELTTYNYSSLVFLSDENGYCSLTIPLTYANEQMKPAFPNGSYFELTISYLGSTWEYTANNIQVNYSDTDLTRNINGIGNFASSSGAVISWYAEFGNVDIAQTVAGYLKCSGRLGLTDDIVANMSISSAQDNKLHFSVLGDYAKFPMRSGDYFTMAGTSLVLNGVTYNISAQTLYGINATAESDFLQLFEYDYVRSGGGTVGDPLSYLVMGTQISDSVLSSVSQEGTELLNVKNLLPVTYCYPTKTELQLVEDLGTTRAEIFVDFEDSPNNDAVSESSEVIPLSFSVTVGGITYVLSQEWLDANIPLTVGGWED